MKTNILKGNLKIFFNSLLALFKKKSKQFKTFALELCAFPFPATKRKQSIFGIQGLIIIHVCFVYYIKSPINIFPHIYMLK